ncbi:MAG TPA: transcriptional repressor [Solirubrobacteraceae bacterium]|jgi:Fur family ferric uptake transcriptional regulator|nr:transcriptional repressor [Solirubrobacteraceae bacterium]
MAADQEKIREGTRRVNDAGEEEIYVLGSWSPKGPAELYLARQEYERRVRGPRGPVKRAKIVSNSALGGSGELSREQQVWADSSRNRIRRAGHRRGGARDVLIELFAREDCALTVQEIDKRLSAWLKDGVVSRPVGIASVYRGVEVLQDLRLIARVDVGDGVARYERAPLQQHDHHHHHFVCDKCGLLVPFDDDALERAIDALESRLGFEAKEHEVVLKGVCVGCR